LRAVMRRARHEHFLRELDFHSYENVVDRAC
jgi:hypothetical protein